MTTPLDIRAVLFDLDDTLYDRDVAFQKWAEAFVTRELLVQDQAEQERLLTMIRDMDAAGYGSKQALFMRLHELYPHLQGQPETSLERFFEQLLALIALDAETVQLLDSLAGGGIPFGVVTNGSHRQWHKIDQLGLRGRTSCLFVSETFGGKKPDPAIFLAAAECLGVPLANVLFVGDHPVNDVCGAQRVGMRTAWLHRDKPWPQEAGSPCADVTLGSLSELSTLLCLP